jgi:hypothetical protein
MLEAVDGIQSSRPIRPAYQTVGRGTGSRLSIIAFCLLLVGILGIIVSIRDDAITLLTLKSILPPGHYLILFQNNAELRSSGGFIGSFATVDVGLFGIKRYAIDTNIYKRDNAFTEKNAIQAPQSLAGASGRWAMRDSNWDLDFRDAAKRVAWFYEQEGGEPVDGVVAVNASVAQDLLRITGPVAVAKLNDKLSADSFFSVLAKEIEVDYFVDPVQQVQNEPKSILREVLKSLVSKIQQPEVAMRLPSLLRQELSEKQIQLYHNNPTAENRIVQAGWGGIVNQQPGDFLLLNNENTGAIKSSLFVGQEILVEITTLLDGSSKHVLTVTRTHTGNGVWPDSKNINYLRVAVPLGSTLQSSILNDQVLEMMDTTVEAQKTVFGTRLDTNPGHTSKLALTYIVPATDSSKQFQLTYQKQSGTLSELLHVIRDGQEEFSGLVQKDLLIRGK